MTSMIEKVARAIYGEETLDDIGQDVANKMRQTARRAIEAMREPTLEMLQDGSYAARPTTTERTRLWDTDRLRPTRATPPT